MGSGASSSKPKQSQSQNASSPIAKQSKSTSQSASISQSTAKSTAKQSQGQPSAPLPQAALPYLKLTFCDTQGRERVVNFDKKPLGLEICVGVAPIRVDNVFAEGLALKNGVEMGWHITKINDRSIAGKTFAEQFSLLKAAMSNLPFSKAHDVRPKIVSLEIVFEDTSTHEPVPVTFAKKPLGIEFDVVAPITVKTIKEDCVARRTGVEVGWIVKTVAGTDLSSLPILEQVEILKKCVRALPDVTYSIAPPLSQSLSGDTSTRAEDIFEVDSTLDEGRL